MRAEIVLFEGFDDLDAFGPFEVLRYAARGAAELSTRLVTLAPAGSVTSSGGAELRPHGVLGAPDLVIVPGGGWNDRAEHGAWAEAERGELPAALRERHEREAVLASVCTGAGILAAAGLLDGRPASTHHEAREDLLARGVEIVDARVVDDGDVLSSGGVTAGIDLALRVVEREWGERLADAIARGIEYARRGPLHLGPKARR